MRGLKATLAVLAAVFLTLAVPASASASTPVATVAGGPVLAASGNWQYDPSGSKWREYMINVTGKLLGDSMPNSWKAEQIANQFRAGKGIPSGEALNQQFGYANYSRDANGKLVEIPRPGQGSYDDYVLDEYQKTRNGTSTRKGVAAPATKGGTFSKLLGAAGALTFFPIGTQLGAGGANIVGGWFGWNAQDAVCSMTQDGGAWNNILQWASGQDCDMWAMDSGLINIDAGGEFGPSVWGDRSIWYMGAFTSTESSVQPTYYGCYFLDGNWTKTSQGFYEMPTVDGRVWWVRFPNEARVPQTTALSLREGITSSSVPLVAQCRQLGGNAYAPIQADSAEVFRAGGFLAGFSRWSNGPLVEPWVGTTMWENPLPAGGAGADPERTMECTVTYTDGTTATSVGAPYHESSGSITPPACPPTPLDKVPDKVTVDQKTKGGIGTGSGGGGSSTTTVIDATQPKASEKVYEEETTPGYKDWVQNYPECGTGACKLDLLVKSPTSDSYASCFDLESGCAGWFDDPAKSSTYTCRYGVKEVSLTECNIYAGLFEPGRVAVGAPYSDPMTGQWSGGSNAPRPDQQAMGQGIRAPETTRGCDGMNVTGFDPVGFVMRPIQCALEWAFVPRQLVMEASMAGAGEAWEHKPPVVVANAVDGFALSPSASGCSRSVTLFGATFPIIDACSGPMAQVAQISTLVTSAGMVLLVIVVLKRQIAAMVGYNQGQG